MAVEKRTTRSAAHVADDERALLPLPPTGRGPIGTNALLDQSPWETLNRARMVLGFVRDWNLRENPFDEDKDVTYGLSIIFDVIDDAVQHAMTRIPTGDAQ